MAYDPHPVALNEDGPSEALDAFEFEQEILTYGLTTLNTANRITSRGVLG
jgi:hypothetical protein